MNAKSYISAFVQYSLCRRRLQREQCPSRELLGLALRTMHSFPDVRIQSKKAMESPPRWNKQTISGLFCVTPSAVFNFTLAQSRCWFFAVSLLCRSLAILNPSCFVLFPILSCYSSQYLTSLSRSVNSLFFSLG